MLIRFERHCTNADYFRCDIVCVDLQDFNFGVYRFKILDLKVMFVIWSNTIVSQIRNSFFATLLGIENRCRTLNYRNSYAKMCVWVKEWCDS